MARKLSTSIYPGPQLEAFFAELGPRTKRHDGVSGVLDRTLERYRHVVHSSIPGWSVDEWLIAVDILRAGDYSTAQGIEVVGLALQVAIERRRAAGGAESSEFAYRAKTLKFAERVAVVEVVERYRRRHATLDRDALAALLAEMTAPIQTTD